MKSILLILFAGFLLVTASGQDFCRNISVRQAEEMIRKQSAKDSLIILDVRTPAEFGRSHLPKAINIDFWGKNFTDSLVRLDPKKTYLVYCTSGVRSSGAVKKMRARGFSRLLNMKKGMMGWRGRKYPLEVHVQ